MRRHLGKNVMMARAANVFFFCALPAKPMMQNKKRVLQNSTRFNVRGYAPKLSQPAHNNMREPATKAAIQPVAIYSRKFSASRSASAI